MTANRVDILFSVAISPQTFMTEARWKMFVNGRQVDKCLSNVCLAILTKQYLHSVDNEGSS